jgi:toxin YoeB
MSRIVFTEKGFAQYVEWQLEDRKTLNKINKLLQSISRDGAMKGEGKPEKLSHAPGTYSRRIDAKNRLVYEMDGDQIIVELCKGHYEE